jgi:hypothetical protein
MTAVCASRRRKLRRLRGVSLRLGRIVAVLDVHVALELFVVLVLHDHLHAQRAFGKFSVSFA